MRSSPDRLVRALGLVLEGPAKFSHPERRGIISNLTELFYLHTLSRTRSSSHTTFFRSIYRSVFRYRFATTGLPARKACGAFENSDGLASLPGGVEILLAASCYKNRDKLLQLRARLAPRLHFYLSQTM